MKDWAEALANLTEQDLATVFRHEHNMVLAIPT
jgi:hypothetical protein